MKTLDEIKSSLPKCPICEAPASLISLEGMGPQVIRYGCGVELQWYAAFYKGNELESEAHWVANHGCQQILKDKLEPDSS